MKTAVFTILTSALLVGGIARADYTCVGSNATLTVNEDNITQSKEVSALLVSEGKQTQLFGSIQSNEGNLLHKKLIKFYGVKGTLSIVSQPQFCGRGACDTHANPIFSAWLEIDNLQTYFSCDEINL